MASTRADAFDARLDLRDYVADGIDDHNEAVAVSTLFKQLPVAVLRVRFEGAAQRVRKRKAA